jgi:predicted HicB family RNase H-like nuclease
VHRYTYRAQWCPDHDEYIASCGEMPFVSRLAPTAHEAIAEVEQAVDEYVTAMRTRGDDPPPPLTERNYSGTIVVRTSPVLHARLAIEAVEQRVSMNQLIVYKLAGRQLSSGFGPFGFD